MTMSSSTSNGSPPRAAGDVADRAAGRVVVLGGEGLDDLEPLPVREAAQDAGLLRVRTRVEAATHLGIGERAAAARAPAGASSPASPGSPSSTKPDRNDSRICIECGSVSATTRPPRSAATSPAAQLLLVPGRVRGRDAEHVPVERAVGGQRHVGDQVDARRR